MLIIGLELHDADDSHSSMLVIDSVDHAATRRSTAHTDCFGLTGVREGLGQVLM
jgi:hypothetical protein